MSAPTLPSEAMRALTALRLEVDGSIVDDLTQIMEKLFALAAPPASEGEPLPDHRCIESWHGDDGAVHRCTQAVGHRGVCLAGSAMEGWFAGPAESMRAARCKNCGSVGEDERAHDGEPGHWQDCLVCGRSSFAPAPPASDDGEADDPVEALVELAAASTDGPPWAAEEAARIIEELLLPEGDHTRGLRSRAEAFVVACRNVRPRAAAPLELREELREALAALRGETEGGIAALREDVRGLGKIMTTALAAPPPEPEAGGTEEGWRFDLSDMPVLDTVRAWVELRGGGRGSEVFVMRLLPNATNSGYVFINYLNPVAPVSGERVDEGRWRIAAWRPLSPLPAPPEPTP